jgi:UDP-glucose 4-epimerase
MVHVSTFKVYGDAPAGVVTEDTPPRPTSHYAITHRVAEDYAASLHRDAVIFRLANGFGAPAEPAAGAWAPIVNGMCREAAALRTITLRSSGLAWRNFVPMDDVLHALRAAIGSLPAGTYNLGASQSLTLRAMAGRVAQACRETLGFLPAVVVGADGAEVASAPLDFRVTKLGRAGVEPAASIDDELARTLQVAHDTFAGASHA